MNEKLDKQVFLIFLVPPRGTFSQTLVFVVVHPDENGDENGLESLMIMLCCIMWSHDKIPQSFFIIGWQPILSHFASRLTLVTKCGRKGQK